MPTTFHLHDLSTFPRSLSNPCLDILLRKNMPQEFVVLNGAALVIVKPAVTLWLYMPSASLSCIPKLVRFSYSSGSVALLKKSKKKRERESQKRKGERGRGREKRRKETWDRENQRKKDKENENKKEKEKMKGVGERERERGKDNKGYYKMKPLTSPKGNGHPSSGCVAPIGRCHT